MLKVSKGTDQVADAARAQAVKDGMAEIILPPSRLTGMSRLCAVLSTGQRRTAGRRQTETEMARQQAEALSKSVPEPEKIIIPPEPVQEIPVIPLQEPRTPESGTVDKETLSRINEALRPEQDVRIKADEIPLPERARENREISVAAERIAGELAEQTRVDITLPPNGNERGRAIEHDEPGRTQTIQKER
jgi:hypothetical protein